MNLQLLWRLKAKSCKHSWSDTIVLLQEQDSTNAGVRLYCLSVHHIGSACRKSGLTSSLPLPCWTITNRRTDTVACPAPRKDSTKKRWWWDGFVYPFIRCWSQTIKSNSLPHCWTIFKHCHSMWDTSQPIDIAEGTSTTLHSCSWWLQQTLNVKWSHHFAWQWTPICEGRNVFQFAQILGFLWRG